MERNYGEQSYCPKNLNLMYMGKGTNNYWSMLNDYKIRQNILWACYNDNLTEDGIALQIGVSLPYIENDIKKFTDTMLELQKQSIDEIGQKLKELHKVTTSILKNHVPTHLKSQVEGISTMSTLRDGTHVPASSLN